MPMLLRQATKVFWVISFSLLVICFPLLAVPVQASSPTLSLAFNPEEGSYKVGDTIIVTVKLTNETASESIQSLGLRIGFSTSRLQYKSFTVPADSLYSESEWVDQSSSPNSNGYVAFTASSTGAKTLSEPSSLLELKFKALKAGTAAIEYQFNDSVSGYTTVIGSSPDTNLVDQTQTTNASFTITAPAGNLPSTGIFDNALLLMAVGSMLSLAGGISLLRRNRFETGISTGYLQ